MSPLPPPINRYIAAYNRRDVADMLAALDQDVVFQNISSGALSAETTGKSAFENLATAGAADFSHRHQEVRHAITVADTTLAEIAFTATVAADLPNGWRAGQELAFEGKSLFELRNDLIVRIIDES